MIRVQRVLVAILAGTIAVGGCAYDPPINDAARHWEKVLDRLAGQALDLPNVTLTERDSSPGQPDGDAPSRVGASVEASRLYALGTTAPPGCEAIRTQLIERGWLSEPCNKATRTGNNLVLSFDRRCDDGFTVHGKVYLRIDTASPRLHRTIEVALRTDYPTNVSVSDPKSGCAPRSGPVESQLDPAHG